jgi:hypothetical protein
MDLLFLMSALAFIFGVSGFASACALNARVQRLETELYAAKLDEQLRPRRTY